MLRSYIYWTYDFFLYLMSSTVISSVVVMLSKNEKQIPSYLQQIVFICYIICTSITIITAKVIINIFQLIKFVLAKVITKLFLSLVYYLFKIFNTLQLITLGSVIVGNYHINYIFQPIKFVLAKVITKLSLSFVILQVYDFQYFIDKDILHSEHLRFPHYLHDSGNPICFSKSYYTLVYSLWPIKFVSVRYFTNVSNLLQNI